MLPECRSNAVPPGPHAASSDRCVEPLRSTNRRVALPETLTCPAGGKASRLLWPSLLRPLANHRLFSLDAKKLLRVSRGNIHLPLVNIHRK